MFSAGLSPHLAGVRQCKAKSLLIRAIGEVRGFNCRFQVYGRKGQVKPRSRKASKKAAMKRFAPSAPQRLCAGTTCRSSGGKGLVSRRDAEAQRGRGPRTVGSFCVSLRFLRQILFPIVSSSIEGFVGLV